MCEIAEVYNTVTRKARKQHRCCECGNPIEIGETYAYSSGIFDHEPFSRKECNACHELLAYIWSLPGVDCIEYGLHQFLIDCDWLEKNDLSNDDEPWQSTVDWLKWENNRWMLAKAEDNCDAA